MGKAFNQDSTIELIKNEKAQQKIVNNYSQRIATELPQHLKQKNNLTILSIGSGYTPFEILALSKHHSNICYIGIELEEKAVEHCNEVFSNYDNVHFFQADGKDKKTIGKAIRDTIHSDQVDMVVMRHPVFHQNNPARHHFTQIWLDVIPTFLKPGGVLISSFYHEQEFHSGLSLTQLIVDNPDSVSALEKNQEVSLREEIEPTALTDRLHTLYEDCYMLLVKNFNPTPGVLNKHIPDDILNQLFRQAKITKESLTDQNVECFLSFLVKKPTEIDSFSSQEFTQDEKPNATNLEHTTIFAFRKYINHSDLLAERVFNLLVKIHGLLSSQDSSEITEETIRNVIRIAAILPVSSELGVEARSEFQTAQKSTPSSFGSPFL